MKNLIAVKKISVNQVSDHDIFKEEIPVVIENGCKSWPASKKWSVDFFRDNYGEVQVPLSNYKEEPYQEAETKSSISIKEYLKEALKITKGEESASKDFYSAGWYFTRGYCQLLDDIDTLDIFKENWANKVQDVLYFDTTSLLFGHPEVESPLHTDSFFVSTWFACVKGQKRMRLVEPKYSEHVCNGYDVYDEKKLEDLASKDVPVFDCVIKEGDIVWFPPGWWHHVKNDSFTISITVNFVSSYHFLPFEQQIRATLLRPLLGLKKLKEKALLRSAQDLENFKGVEFSPQNLNDSQYLELEKRYVTFLQGEVRKTTRLLGSLSLSC